MTGDQEAEWRRLHAEHAAALRRFVTRLTSDRSRADDVVQEVLVRAWRSDAFAGRDDRAVHAWMCTAARRLVIDNWRSASSRHEVSVADVAAAGTDDESAAVLDRQVVADALAALSPEQRSAVVAAYYQGQTIAEMAKRWQLPQGTIKSRLHYGLRSLRRALQDADDSQEATSSQGEEVTRR